MKSDRQRALDALNSVKFIPAWGENRIRAAVENRPDWCISQAHMGRAIPAFYDEDGNAYIDPAVIRSFAAKLLNQEPTFGSRKQLPRSSMESHFQAASAEQLKCGTDTDVWIDSGTSHRAMYRSANLSWPADLSSRFGSTPWLVPKLSLDRSDRRQDGLQDASYARIYRQGRRRSFPKVWRLRPLTDWIKSYGADIIRLWISLQDYRNDVPVSDKIVKNVANNYRNIKTLRFQIGNLHFNPETNSFPLRNCTRSTNGSSWAQCSSWQGRRSL